MCLAIVLFQTHPDWPLLVAANRDELLARPAVAMTVLSQAGPRIVGGRDLVAGGTWLAVNEHGLVAALTNRPGATRDGSKRSRGELPLALARHVRAEDAVAAFASAHRPADYNPAWLLVGDREALFYVDMTGADATVTRLAPGLHVLENHPYGAPSAKVDHVAAAMRGAEARRGDDVVPFLHGVLSDHTVPAGADLAGWRPAPTWAACVHAGAYGTRSAEIALVPPAGRPHIWVADGPSCVTPLVARNEMNGPSDAPDAGSSRGPT